MIEGLNYLIKDFSIIFSRASFNLIPIALGFLSWMIAFQVIFDLLKNITDLPFFRLLKSILVYFGYKYVIENWNQIISMLKDTVVRIGEKGAGVPYDSFSINPDLIFTKVFNIFQPLANKFEIFSAGTYGYGVAWLLGILLGLFLTLNLFIFYLEFLAVTSISIIFVPFLAFEKTDFLGKKVFSAVTSQLIRLLFYSFLISVCLNHLSENISNIEEIKDGFYLVLRVGGLSWLTWKVPELIGALLNGTPSLNWNSAWNSGKTGFDSTKSVGRGAKSVGRGIRAVGQKTYGGYKTKVSQMANFKRPDRK